MGFFEEKKILGKEDFIGGLNEIKIFGLM